MLSCARGDLAGGTSETETGTASGQLVLKGGAEVQGARVTLFAVGEDTGKAVTGARTVVTDASGTYKFDSLALDTYNMTALYVPEGSKDTLVASRLRIEVTETDRDVEVGVDTLRGPGAIEARVLFLSNPVEEALCYVPGTSYIALTDAEGRCLVSGIPPGRYRISFKADGYLTARARDTVLVATDDTVRLGDAQLQLDDRLAPPKPTGLKVVFDTSTRKVTLTWSRVPAGDLAGYALFRDSVAAVTFTRLTPDRLIQDTFYIDTLAGINPGSDTVLAYRIKAQDRSGEQSGFALFDTVRVRLIRRNQAPTVPSAPRPLDSSIGAPLTVTLQWKSRDADGDSILADIYFGKQNPPHTRIAQAVRDSFLVVPSLDSLSSYYWRVAVTDGSDTAPGPVWSFKTGTPPGEGWTRLGEGVFQPMDLWFADKHKGWVVGPFGDITHTPDGGMTWLPQISGDTNLLNAVQFTDTLHGWAVGHKGTILRTRDGGARWDRMPSPVDRYFNDLYFLNDQEGWVVGYRSEAGQNYSVVQKTEDGGTTWTDQAAENTQFVERVQFLNADVGYLFAFRYGQTFVIRTVDGGQNWEASDSTGIVHPNAMQFLNPDTGWVGGASINGDKDLLAHTVDGGRTWTLNPVPGIQGLSSLGFADGKTGWAVGTGVHKTMDGGVTWQSENVEAGGLNQFLAYFNLDRENGWAVGMLGAVYKRPPLPNP